MNCESVNIVGLAVIEFISARRVSSFHMYPRLDGSYSGSVTLQQGYSWKVLSEMHIDADKRYWQEGVLQNAAHGDITENKVFDIISEKTDFTRVELDDMQRDKFLVRFTTQNGDKFLLGDMNYPLSIKIDHSSKTANYPAEFSNQQPHKALIWNYE